MAVAQGTTGRVAVASPTPGLMAGAVLFGTAGAVAAVAPQGFVGPVVAGPTGRVAVAGATGYAVVASTAPVHPGMVAVSAPVGMAPLTSPPGQVNVRAPVGVLPGVYLLQSTSTGVASVDHLSVILSGVAEESLLVLVLTFNDIAQRVLIGVQDNVNGSWTQVGPTVTSTQGAVTGNTTIWALPDAPAATTVVITATLDGVALAIAGVVAEYAGMPSTVTVVGSHSATDVSAATTHTSGAGAVTDRALLLGGASDLGARNDYSAGVGWNTVAEYSGVVAAQAFLGDRGERSTGVVAGSYAEISSTSTASVVSSILVALATGTNLGSPPGRVAVVAPVGVVTNSTNLPGPAGAVVVAAPAGVAAAVAGRFVPGPTGRVAVTAPAPPSSWLVGPTGQVTVTAPAGTVTPTPNTVMGVPGNVVVQAPGGMTATPSFVPGWFAESFIPVG